MGRFIAESKLEPAPGYPVPGYIVRSLGCTAATGVAPAETSAPETTTGTADTTTNESSHLVAAEAK